MIWESIPQEMHRVSLTLGCVRPTWLFWLRNTLKIEVRFGGLLFLLSIGVPETPLKFELFSWACRWSSTAPPMRPRLAGLRF